MACEWAIQSSKTPKLEAAAAIVIKVPPPPEILKPRPSRTPRKANRSLLSSSQEPPETPHNPNDQLNEHTAPMTQTMTPIRNYSIQNNSCLNDITKPVLRYSNSAFYQIKLDPPPPSNRKSKSQSPSKRQRSCVDKRNRSCVHSESSQNFEQKFTEISSNEENIRNKYLSSESNQVSNSVSNPTIEYSETFSVTDNNNSKSLSSNIHLIENRPIHINNENKPLKLVRSKTYIKKKSKPILSLLGLEPLKRTKKFERSYFSGFASPDEFSSDTTHLLPGLPDVVCSGASSSEGVGFFRNVPCILE